MAKVTLSTSLLKRPAITEPLKQSLPVVFIAPKEQDLKTDTDFLADQSADLLLTHQSAIDSYPQDSLMAQAGKILQSALVGQPPEIQALLSPLVEDYAHVPVSVDYSDRFPLAQTLTSYSPEELAQAKTGFESATQILQKQASETSDAHRILSEMLLRGYTEILPQLSNTESSVGKIALGIPLKWATISRDLQGKGLSGPANALKSATLFVFQSYTDLSSHAQAAQKRLQHLDRMQAHISDTLSNLSQWASIADSLRYNQDPIQAAQQAKSKLISLLMPKVKSYLQSLYKKKEKKKNPLAILTPPVPPIEGLPAARVPDVDPKPTAGLTSDSNMEQMASVGHYSPPNSTTA